MRGSRQTVLLARRAPTIKRWSLDARSEEQSAYSLWRSSGIRRPSPGKRKVSGTITHQNSPPSIQTMVPDTFLFPVLFCSPPSGLDFRKDTAIVAPHTNKTNRLNSTKERPNRKFVGTNSGKTNNPEKIRNTSPSYTNTSSRPHLVDLHNEYATEKHPEALSACMLTTIAIPITGNTP
jgi:hypothetical protein